MRCVTLWLISICVVGSTTIGLAGERVALSTEPSRDFLASYAKSLEAGSRALPYRFTFPTDVRSDLVMGIDVSHYQGEVDWRKVALQKVSFAYVKATQGSRYYDTQFSGNWNRSGAIRVLFPSLRRGAYHFMTAKDAASEQASNFLAVLGKALPEDLPPCLDLEWDFVMVDGAPLRDKNGRPVDQWAALSSGEIVARVKTWLNFVQAATSKVPIIYTNASWWKQRIGSDLGLKGYRLWIADYTSKSLDKENPVVPQSFEWSFWQLTDKGKVAQGGVNKVVDVSSFNGSLADFASQFGSLANAASTR